MNEPALERASYGDVLAAPPTVVAEVIGGRLYTAPRPAAPHAWIASTLGGLLVSRFGFGVSEQPGGWRIFFEPELHLGSEPDIVVPDLAGWRLERMPEVPNAAYLELPPDWVCEVLSPSTEALDRTEKMDVYLRVGVTHLWLVAPGPRTLEVYRNEELGRARRWVRVATHHGRAGVCVEPFAAVTIDLAVLWPR